MKNLLFIYNQRIILNITKVKLILCHIYSTKFVDVTIGFK